MTGSRHIMLTSSPTTSLLLEVLPERRVQSPISTTKLSSRRPFNGANCKVFLWRCHPKGKPKSSFCHQAELKEAIQWSKLEELPASLSFGGVTQKKKSKSSFCHEADLEEAIQWSTQEWHG
ncbi:unnamed protein product [Musa banksii]